MQSLDFFALFNLFENEFYDDKDNETIPILEKRKYKFVIHEHHAKKAGLHWDIRLQFKACKNKADFCLLSFATRKLPNLVDKKLNKIAVFRTPDHEKWWLNFEGELKVGYGAGDIYIWDKGYIVYYKYEPNNKIVVRFYGNKIKGLFAFIKSGKLTKDDRNDAWLLIRMKNPPHKEK